MCGGWGVCMGGRGGRGERDMTPDPDVPLGGGFEVGTFFKVKYVCLIHGNLHLHTTKHFYCY